MDWTKSYSSTWRVFRVNKDTWADAESVPNIISASVTKTADGDMIESGSLEVTGDFVPDYYRIVLTAEQGGEIERVNVATLMFIQNGGEFDFGVNTSGVNGYSVLYPASTKTIITGEYAPAGINGAEYAGQLLREAVNAPVIVEGSFILNDHIIHELGSSVLNAVWNVLNAGNFVIQIDGDGTIYIRPKPTDPSLVIDNSSAGILMDGIRFTSDISSIPNRYIIIEDVNITIAENNDPKSEVSFISRGYYVDVVDTSPTPINGETYSAYANRMLRSMSIMEEEREYNREYAPNVYPASIVKSTINGLEGDLIVKSQSITCGNGVLVSEKVAKEIRLYE